MKPEITKLEEKLPEGKASELRGMTESELKQELLKVAQQKEAYITLKNEDKELAAVKETVKELAAPHSEAIKAAKTLHRFIALLLAEKNIKE